MGASRDNLDGIYCYMTAKVFAYLAGEILGLLLSRFCRIQRYVFLRVSIRKNIVLMTRFEQCTMDLLGIMGTGSGST